MQWSWLDEVLPDAVVVTDGEQRIIAFNGAAERLWGYRAVEAIGGPLSMLLPHRLAAAHGQQVNEFGATGDRVRRMDRRAEVFARRHDGTEVPCEVSVARRVGDGQVQFVAIVRDVSERRNGEAQLRHAQKMDTVGQLAGGIAHDFNNLLAVVTSAAAELRHELGPGHRLLPEVADIEGATARAAALTQQLLSFARLQPSRPRVVDVSVVVTAFERLLRRVIGGHLRVQLKLEPGCFVCIDPMQLDQILMNLAVNARDAMPSGGTLTLSTELLAREREVLMRVCDTGAGIDPAIRGRLFEPFFTTKPQGQGTGLGLATCYGIVKQTGGRMEVTSEQGKGACFELGFPLALAPA